MTDLKMLTRSATRADETPKRPDDMTELREMFASRTLTLPKQLEQIARAALASPDLVAFGSARSIARACSVSPTTVARFATALGFNDFRALKAFFQHHLRHARTASAPQESACRRRGAG